MDELERLIARVPRPEASTALDRRIELLVEDNAVNVVERPQRLPAGRGRRLWLPGLAAMAAIVAMFFYGVRPESTWAQVAAAVQGKPWIRMTLADAPPKSQFWGELWFSLSRDMAASRLGGPDGESVSFTDLQAGIEYNFDSKSKTLVRLRSTEMSSFQSLLPLLRSLLRGEQPAPESFGGGRIGERKQRKVEEDGKSWSEFEFEVLHGRPDETATLVIRVDPDTKLPVWMEFVAMGQSSRFDFDYPAAGPADIYALGVPRDTPLEDRIPNGELSGIIEKLQAGQRDLDNYFAAVHEGYPEQLSFVWRKGNKWRIEVCGSGTEDDDPGDGGLGVVKTRVAIRAAVPHIDLSDMPNDETQLAAWWREHLKRFSPVPILVCDGEHIYRFQRGRKVGAAATDKWKLEQTVGPDAGHSNAGRRGEVGPAMIEFAAYPQIVMAENIKLTLDPNGAGGPAGSVLLEENFAPQENDERDIAIRRHRIWLDPKHGFAVVKDEGSDCPALDNDPRQIFKDITVEYEDFRQSPRGVWYPTLSRQKHSVPQVDKTGKVLRYDDEETRFYLDFSAELPDELFTPTARKVLGP